MEAAFGSRFVGGPHIRKDSGTELTMEPASFKGLCRDYLGMYRGYVHLQLPKPHLFAGSPDLCIGLRNKSLQA